jgi:hypothetical protein
MLNRPFLKYKNLSIGPEKCHGMFQKIFPGTGPKYEPVASLIESSNHTKLTTMFSGNSIMI